MSNLSLKTIDLSTEHESKSNISPVKLTFYEWSKRVDINCYTKMLDYQGNFIVQSFWLFILLASTGATFYLIAASVMDFFKFEVTTQIKIINEKPVAFPAITFCNKNPLSSSEAQILLQNVSIQNNIIFQKSIRNASHLAMTFASSKFYDTEKKKLLSSFHKINCKFRDIDCTNDLTWFWSHDYGNCYQFNSDSNNIKYVTRKGIDFGLNVGISSLINPNQTSNTIKGTIVFVHNNSFEPSEGLEGVFVQAQKITYISVSRTFTQKYPTPYSDCINLDSYKSDLYDYIIKLNKTYRQQDCFELCIQREIIDKCKCYYTKYNELEIDVRPCLSLNDSLCADDKYDNFNLDECQTNSCPLECDSMTYELSWSSLEYENQNFDEILFENAKIIRNFPMKNLVKSFTTFSVSYENLHYTHISESPKTAIIDLFTQIGGSLGMFVSFSIFTLFEFIEIIVLILKALFTKPKIRISN